MEIIMKISTGNGDFGFSSLADGKPLPKSDMRFEVLGDIDELSAAVALCRAAGGNKDFIDKIQKLLINIMSFIASGGDEKYYLSLNEAENFYSDNDFDFNGFLTFGENELSARLNFARTVARRTERHFVAYANVSGIKNCENVFIFLNRLSDALFTEAAKLSRQQGNA